MGGERLQLPDCACLAGPAGLTGWDAYLVSFSNALGSRQNYPHFTGEESVRRCKMADLPHCFAYELLSTKRKVCAPPTCSAPNKASEARS